MSCSTLDTQSVGLNVAVANLPEGFCPASMQELLQAFGARLIVTPNQGFFGFAIGSVEPTSNVGPWLKDCLEIFVYDDATARYIPLQIRGGFQNQQYFTASGAFIVPEFVYRLKVTGWGGGGGGFADGSLNPQSGGGGGGRGIAIFTVIPGQTINFTVGAGGSTGNPATAGGNTTFLTMTAGGGNGGVANQPIAGGIVTGADFPTQGGPSEHPSPSENVGMAGSSPGGGSGGTWSNVGGNTLINGIVPGGGGSGGYGAPGGSGASGGLLIEY